MIVLNNLIIPVRGAGFKSKLSEVSRNRRTQPKGKAAEGDPPGWVRLALR